MSSQNGKKKSKRFSAHHIAKNKIITVFAVIIIVVFICLVTWKSLSYAEAIFEAIIGVCGAVGIIADAIFYIVKKDKFNAFLFAIAIIVIIANAVWARGTLSDINVESKNVQITEASSENINGNEGKKVNNREEKDIKEFIWHDDIYIISINDYLNGSEDKDDCLVMLIGTYLESYVLNVEVLVKSDEELNAGDYGKYINLAKQYARDYEKCTMNDVKMYALEKEIEMRELANNSYKKYDNLKILGDCHVNKITLSDLRGNNKKGELEIALKYYIEALAYAQYDKKATKNYISEIWDEINKVYKALYDSEELDDAHKNQILEIIEACKNCRHS